MLPQPPLFPIGKTAPLSSHARHFVASAIQETDILRDAPESAGPPFRSQSLPQSGISESGSQAARSESEIPFSSLGAALLTLPTLLLRNFVHSLATCHPLDSLDPIDLRPSQFSGREQTGDQDKLTNWMAPTGPRCPKLICIPSGLLHGSIIGKSVLRRNCQQSFSRHSPTTPHSRSLSLLNHRQERGHIFLPQP